MAEKRTVSGKTVVALSISLVICLAAVAGIFVYHQSVLSEKDSQISSLKTLMKESSSEIENLTNSMVEKDEQINNLNDEIGTFETEKDDLSSQLSAVKNERATLKSQVSDLNTEIQTTISTLEYTKTNYENQIIVLSNQTEALQLQIEEKDGQINDLEIELQNHLSNITYLISEIENIQAQISSLQEDYANYVNSYLTLRYIINQRSIQMNPKTFIKPYDAEVIDTVQTITGGWSNPSDFDEFWTDVKTLYLWVRSNIDYRYDGLAPILPSEPSYAITYRQDMWQYPTETLELEKGDCDDQAILLCSMIECYSNQTYDAECIWISGSEGAHIAVQLPVSGDKLVILDPAGNYYSKDWIGNIVFNDVAVEISNWLNYWKPELGSDVYVYRVFSYNIDETFASTSEYLDWMLS